MSSSQHVRIALSVIVIGLITSTIWAQKEPARGSGLKNPAPVTESLPPGPMQEKAATSCTECHEARIILQQRLSKAAWTKEVDKMIKWGAVVDASDHDALVDYLSGNFGVDRGAYDPPRTSSRKGR